MVSTKHKKIYDKIFKDPITPIDWPKIESMLVALGAEVEETKGSGVSFFLNNVQANFHRPHPGNEAKRYVVKKLREFLTAAQVRFDFDDGGN